MSEITAEELSPWMCLRLKGGDKIVFVGDVLDDSFIIQRFVRINETEQWVFQGYGRTLYYMLLEGNISSGVRIRSTDGVSSVIVTHVGKNYVLGEEIEQIPLVELRAWEKV